MAADKNGDQDLVEHFFLPDDDLVHLVEDLLAHRMEALHALLQQRCFLVQSGKSHRFSLSQFDFAVGA